MNNSIDKRAACLAFLAGVWPPEGVENLTMGRFIEDLITGKFLRWRGAGKEKYCALCVFLELPEPDFDGRRRLLKSPASKILEIK